MLLQKREVDSSQEGTLSPTSSGQAPASWPLLGEAKARTGQALESALSNSGRML